MNDDDIEERPIEEVEAGIENAGKKANALIIEYAMALRREKKMTYREVRKHVIRFFQIEGGLSRQYIERHLPSELRNRR